MSLVAAGCSTPAGPLVGGSGHVRWVEDVSGACPGPFDGAFVPTLRPSVDPQVAPSAPIVRSAEAHASLGQPFSPVGLDSATLARLSGVSRRAADALGAAWQSSAAPSEAPELLRVRHVGPKSAARLASLLSFAPTEAPTCWPVATTSARRDGVLRPFLVELLRFLPQAGISRAWGWLARVRWPKFAVLWLKQTFVRANGLDMSESLAPLESFACLEDLFVRELKPGLRPIDEDIRTLVSPVDGRVGATGIVTDGLLLQVKGHSYTLAEMLDEPSNARFFEGGAYVTLYLAPKDYHRIHAPQAGHVTSARLVPGALMPVFPEALLRVEQLFARNERLISYMRSPDAGGIALVAVGATLVGRIRVNYDASLRGNQEKQRVARAERYAKPVWFERGEEMGAFELGSTVVLICQPGMVVLDPLVEGQFIKLGERIGMSQKPARGRDTGGGPEFLLPANDDEL